MTGGIVSTIILALIGGLVGVLLVSRGSKVGQRATLQEVQDRETRLGTPEGAGYQDPDADFIQTERRNVYAEILKANRQFIEALVGPVAGISREPEAQIRLTTLEEATTRLQDLQARIDVFASPRVLDLSTALYTAIGQCSGKLSEEIERQRSQLDRTDLEAVIGAWEKAEPTLQTAFRDQHIRELYDQLRDQVRKELGSEVIEPVLAPTVDGQLSTSEDGRIPGSSTPEPP